MKKILSCLAQFLNVYSVNNGLNPISSICVIVDELTSDELTRRFALLVLCFVNSNYQGDLPCWFYALTAIIKEKQISLSACLLVTRQLNLMMMSLWHYAGTGR